MRHLGIDYGTRRIGLALSDEGGRLATPLEVLQVTDPHQAVAPISALVEAEQVAVLVVGLPLNMDDSVGPAARAVREWGTGLSRTAGRPVVFVDERLSSFEAEQALRQRKQAGQRMTRQGRKQRLDAVAAAQLLQSYLDGVLKPLPDEDKSVTQVSAVAHKLQLWFTAQTPAGRTGITHGDSHEACKTALCPAGGRRHLAHPGL